LKCLRLALILFGGILIFFAIQDYGKSLSNTVISFILKLLYGRVEALSHIIEAFSLSPESPVILMMKLQRNMTSPLKLGSSEEMIVEQFLNLISLLFNLVSLNFCLFHAIVVVLIAAIFFFNDLVFIQEKIKNKARKSSRGQMGIFIQLCCCWFVCLFDYLPF
jgi:hypothetical protein